MIEALKDAWNAGNFILQYWVYAAASLGLIAQTLRLGDSRDYARSQRLARVRSDAALSFAANLQRGTETRKFILLFRRGFQHELNQQFPAFQPYLEARIAAAMDDRS
ncbi:hypothetical protein ACQZ61_04250 [Agrobacterium vitis]|uniref:hypothetical protein n=1 Tax=Agrobacterium vitis TaxID=373 RepID=UPI0012E7236E|nr:hypothetical protein [Agrobacterium vitis]MCF1452264.1 hypothetical protein [Agrobacterium vitis]MVA47746.1 hypothetical protein [Agrobacterium vitis]